MANKGKTPADLGKIENAKNTAAVKALEAYVASLRESLSDAEIAALDMHGTKHRHLAVLLLPSPSGGTEALALEANWSFSRDPDVVGDYLTRKAGQGQD